MGFRRPTADEYRLFKKLAELAKFADPEAWVRGLRVREMDDGGMGSLEIERPPQKRDTQSATVCLAAVQFCDADNVEVIASLNAREDGAPFELDIWKTDFTKLVHIPAEFRRVDE